MKKLICLALALVMALSITACSSSRPNFDYSYEDGVPSLWQEMSEWFHVGVAINSWNLNDTESPEYKTLFNHFDTYVYENETKIDAMQPREGQFNFEATDRLAEFCEENGKRMRGHTLVWHSQCPDWFFFDGDGEASAELVLERQKTHITTIMSRYKGKVDSWDVCNEVIGDGGGLRDSYWLQRVGDYDGDGDKYDFIEQAFITAREVDPDARLMINDYSIESSESKAVSMYLAVKKMLEDGTPIDGIGFQMHIGVNTDIEQMRRNFEILGRLREIKPDLIFEVTELDMSVYNWGDNNEVEYDKELAERQSAKYRELFEFLIEQAELGYLDSVVFWGLSDGNSWLNKDNQKNYPMLFGREFTIKDCFWEVLDVAKEQKAK